MVSRIPQAVEAGKSRSLSINGLEMEYSFLRCSVPFKEKNHTDIHGPSRHQKSTGLCKEGFEDESQYPHRQRP